MKFMIKMNAAIEARAYLLLRFLYTNVLLWVSKIEAVPGIQVHCLLRTYSLKRLVGLSASLSFQKINKVLKTAVQDDLPSPHANNRPKLLRKNKVFRVGFAFVLKTQKTLELFYIDNIQD